MKNHCSQEPNAVNKIQHASVLARLNDRSQWHRHFPNRSWLVRGFWHSQPWYITQIAAVCIWHYTNTAGLAPVVHQGLDSISQDGSTSVASREARGRRSSSAGVCARDSVVCRLLQPGGWHHHRPWFSLSSLRRWHTAPPRHECRQHSCMTVCSCCVYHWRQTVVIAKRPAAQPGQVGGSNTM